MKDAIDELSENVSVPFEQARTRCHLLCIHRENSIRCAELQHVFKTGLVLYRTRVRSRKWGDYIALDLLWQPIVVLRDKSGELQAMSNNVVTACRHC